MASPTSPEHLFADALARDPGRPFVTYYDDATGERSELSLKSLANWVAKTHHLLVSQLGLDVGAGAYVDLPAHWISVVPILGALSAGLTIGTDPDTAEVAFVSQDSVGHAAGVPDVFAVATATAAVGFGDHVPAGAEDFVVAVRPQEDKWPGVHFPAGPEVPAVDGRSRAEVVADATARAGELGFGPGARVLVTRDWQGSQEWVDTVLAPLAVHGSVVFVRNADPTALDRRAEQERVTNRL